MAGNLTLRIGNFLALKAGVIYSQTNKQAHTHTHTHTRMDIVNEDNLTRFIDIFLRGSALQRMIKFFCELNNMHHNDPLTHVVCVMISTPIGISLTEVGVLPFKEQPTFVYPYNNMTSQQRQLVKDMLHWFKQDYINKMRTLHSHLDARKSSLGKRKGSESAAASRHIGMEEDPFGALVTRKPEEGMLARNLTHAHGASFSKIFNSIFCSTQRSLNIFHPTNQGRSGEASPQARFLKADVEIGRAHV